MLLRFCSRRGLLSFVLGVARRASLRTHPRLVERIVAARCAYGSLPCGTETNKEAS